VLNVANYPLTVCLCNDWCWIYW